MTLREKHGLDSARDTGYLASIKVDECVRYEDPRQVQQKKYKTMPGFLSSQVENSSKRETKEDNGKFFGMSDEEILLNQSTFRQMGLLK